MSGGVDSSVAAAVDQGFDIEGLQKNWAHEPDVFGRCPWQDDIDNARTTAEAINLQVVNLMDAYNARVVRALVDGYASAQHQTPMPCNSEIKFGVFREFARAAGLARWRRAAMRGAPGPSGTWDILEAEDTAKDQTYFLALLRQSQIRAALSRWAT